MSDLTGYRVRFFKVPLLGGWKWAATTPDGRNLYPQVIGGWLEKSAAETNALSAIKADAQREEITGDTLERRIREREEDNG